MSERALIQCMWDGEVFRPQTPFQLRRARDRFGDGEIVVLSAEEERSMRSHRHYFAALHDLWATLPERYAGEQWAQSSEHLRRYALIRSGYSDTTTFPCTSEAEARRWAQNMRPLDEFSIVLAKGATVIRYAARSQSVKAMGAKDFQASKDAVLGFVTSLVEEAAA